ncbi:Taste receptor type 2 member 13, partial [Chaetura pelagica]
QKFNVTTYNVVAISLISLQTFAGMWINAFMFSVLCIAWVRKKSSNSNEKILVFLGCTRFWYLCFSWVGSIIENIFHLCLCVNHLSQLLSGILTFFSCSSLWVSAFLSVFYCIKIANFQHSFFIHLKVKIDRIVPWVLLAALLLLFSLWRHKHKMQMKSLKNVSMDAHIKAMKYILSFFFLHSIHFICLVLVMIYESNEANAVNIFLLFFEHALPAVHSLILIFSNPKLKKTLLTL